MSEQWGMNTKVVITKAATKIAEMIKRDDFSTHNIELQAMKIVRACRKHRHSLRLLKDSQLTFEEKKAAFLSKDLPQEIIVAREKLWPLLEHKARIKAGGGGRGRGAHGNER